MNHNSDFIVESFDNRYHINIDAKCIAAVARALRGGGKDMQELGKFLSLLEKLGL